MIVLRRIFNYSEEDLSGNSSSEDDISRINSFEEDKSEEDISRNNSSEEDKFEEDIKLF